MMDPSREKDNANPIVFGKKERRVVKESEYDNSIRDAVNAEEIFDLIRGIKDPEHPLTLEELNVVQEEHTTVDEKEKLIEVVFTPTIEHCSLASLIGLCIQVKLLRSLPPEFKIFVKIAPGSHSTEEAVNKQLADKERVAAALENNQLLEVINQCLIDSL